MVIKRSDYSICYVCDKPFIPGFYRNRQSCDACWTLIRDGVWTD